MIDVAAIRQRFSAVAPFLDERGRRVVAAAEAAAAGYGGIAAVSMATRIAASTIGRGLRELSDPEELDRVRRPGGGRKTAAAKDATLLSDLGGLVEPCSLGDPQSALRWTCKIWWIKRSTMRAPAGAGASGARPSSGPHLVSNLLDGMGYSLPRGCKAIARRAKVTATRTGMPSSSTSMERRTRHWPTVSR